MEEETNNSNGPKPIHRKRQQKEEDSNSTEKKNSNRKLIIEGYQIEGLSIAGHETCVILPSLNLAFDIGKCPQRAVSQQFLFISHAHMDHIGGLPMYVATRGLYRMSPPTIVVPTVIKESVEKLFEAHRSMDQSELNHTLVGLDVGEEFYLRKDLKVKAFRTYHRIPSQGYVVYNVKHKLKKEYEGLPGDEIKRLKLSSVEITTTATSPEIAFTGDTMSDFIIDENNADVLRAKILIMESTYVEKSMTVENARDYGHTHLSEIIGYTDKFENKAILLIHFSARYQLNVIQEALNAVPPPLGDRIFALTEGRSQSILAVLRTLDADFLCLQELDQYDAFYKENVENCGYSSIYYAVTGKKCVGCGIFYKLNKSELVMEEKIDFNDLVDLIEDKESFWNDQDKSALNDGLPEDVRAGKA